LLVTAANRGNEPFSALFPQEPQAARYRERQRHGENGRARVGFDGFKQALDRSSHINASSVWPAVTPATMPVYAGSSAVRKRTSVREVWGTNIA
jgi:hypothetical protein